MATIHDVARMAGVSTATVSHVMNGTRHVAEPTRQRVLAAMADLRFRPSVYARAMRGQSFKTIGLIVSYFSDPFYAKVFDGLSRAAQSLGYGVMVASSNEEPHTEQQSIQFMMRNGLSGIVLAPCPYDQNVQELLESTQFPTVLIDRTWAHTELPSVVLDNRQAIHDLVDYLFRKGHRDIAYISGRPGISTTTERLDGYQEAMCQRSLTPLVVSGDSTQRGGVDAADWWFDHRETISAIICSNDLMLTGLLEGLSRYQNSRHQVVVVGVDNEPWMALVTPRITVIDQPVEEMGETAGRVLIRRIETGEAGAVEPYRGALVVRD